jgi:EAL domain-containing protein (putative c-di-GMP-specific phosphodiesterase class I)
MHAEELLHAADAAMFRAKGLGRARHELFSDPADPASGRTRLALEADLRRAVSRAEIQIAYQPIVSLETGRISGFEALSRWQHPERGLVPPGHFIPIAEETGILAEIDGYVLNEACRTMAGWQRDFDLPVPLTIAVNASPRRFDDDALIEQIKSVIAEHRLLPGTLKLEITESLLLEQDTSVLARLEKLKSLGVRLVIDDFGTGYSALAYLHKLPLDTLKIDQSFIKNLTEQKEVVRTILALAKQLGLDAVAEGVETAEQLACLRGLGCQLAQGYFFARPVLADEACLLVKREIEVLDVTRKSGRVRVRPKKRKSTGVC